MLPQFVALEGGGADKQLGTHETAPSSKPDSNMVEGRCTERCASQGPYGLAAGKTALILEMWF